MLFVQDSCKKISIVCYQRFRKSCFLKQGMYEGKSWWRAITFLHLSQHPTFTCHTSKFGFNQPPSLLAMPINIRRDVIVHYCSHQSLAGRYQGHILFVRLHLQVCHARLIRDPDGAWSNAAELCCACTKWLIFHTPCTQLLLVEAPITEPLIGWSATFGSISSWEIIS